MLYSYILEKLQGFRVFSQSETIHYKKLNKSVSNTITFYLEDDNHKEVYFNEQTLTFILQTFKILTLKRGFRSSKLIGIALMVGITVLQQTLWVK